ncbi:Jag family protein [Bifidobacterium polysaccharolyticum]
MSQSLDQGKTIEQLNEEADVAADYLEGLLDIADYEGDIEMGVRNHRPTVQIVADDDTDIKHLIGKDGEVVDALQQLTRLAVQQKIGERSHLIVDVDGFLRRKREHLREQALDVIDEVRETGDPVNMKPMNSFERKIVHDMVREEGLKSRSHGEEPHRYVTVYLKAKSEDEDLPDDVEDEPVGYDDPLDVDETDQVVDSADYEADDDPADADRE